MGAEKNVREPQAPVVKEGCWEEAMYRRPWKMLAHFQGRGPAYNLNRCEKSALNAMDFFKYFLSISCLPGLSRRVRLQG